MRGAAVLAILASILLIVYFGRHNTARNDHPLPVARISIHTSNGEKKFKVEVAADPTTRNRGLMFRRSLAPDGGMLFDFHHASNVTFWMKDTPLPLDILFIRSDGTISNIDAYAIPYSTTPIPSGEPVRAVLEINGGLAHDLSIHEGDHVHGAIFDAVR